MSSLNEPTSASFIPLPKEDKGALSSLAIFNSGDDDGDPQFSHGPVNNNNNNNSEDIFARLVQSHPRWVRWWIIIAVLSCTIMLVPSLAMAMMSPMMFDDPNQNMGQVYFLYLLALLYPFVILGCAIRMCWTYRQGNLRGALVASLVPLVWFWLFIFGTLVLPWVVTLSIAGAAILCWLTKRQRGSE